MKKKSVEDLLNEISKKLDVLARLLCLSLPKELSQQNKIQILAGIGLGPTEISVILGTTTNTVKVALNRMKKQTTKSK